MSIAPAPAESGPSADQHTWRARLAGAAARPGGWLLVALLLAAFALRFWRLDALPPGFQFDEAHNALDALRVLGGDRQPFYTDNGGREAVNIYLYALVMALLGTDRAVVALRLVSALVGLLTVALLYRFVASFYRDRFLAALAAGFLGLSYWHLHFSRYAIRAIFAPLWAIGAVWAWWRAVGGDQGAEGARRWWPALACGICLAGAFWSHPTGRLLPLILLGHAVYLSAAAYRRRGSDVRAAGRIPPAALRPWLALALAGSSALVFSLPLLVWFARHPGWFTAHPTDVSLAALAARDFGGSLVAALAHNAGAVLGMFALAGDPSTFHNLPHLPVFDPLSALFFVLGLGALVAALVTGPGGARDRAVLLTLWLLVMLAPTLFSDRPPNYSRAIAALPVVALLPAIGLSWVMDRLPPVWQGRRWGLAALALLLAGGWTATHYFGSFARLDHAYYSYDVEKIDAYRALSDLAGEAEVFLHPLWAEHATIAFLNRAGPVRTLDARQSLVLPAGSREVVVAFPAKEADREGWLAAAKDVYGAAAVEGEIQDAHGRPALRTLRLPAGALGDLAPPSDAPLEPATWTSARFGGMIELLGYSLGPAQAGEPLALTFVWRALEPLPWNYTTFVHLLGPGGANWGQEDREPAFASFRTHDWQAGDVVIDRFTPMLAPEARGPLTLRVGWYDAATGERLRLGEADALTLRPVEVGP